jgi:O-antigen ligase
LRARFQMLSEPMARERYAGISMFAAFGLLGLLLAFFSVRAFIAPDGNLAYRLHTYEKALSKFLESPLYGTVFTGPATEKFDLFTVGVSATNVLPTHSDPLDILANGGVLFSALFLYAMWKILRMMSSAVDSAPNSEAEACVPALHTCAAVFLSGLLTMSFNPVMTQPNCALMLWTTTGIGIGLALYVKHSSRVLG